MSSGMRNMIREAVLWLAVFASALAAFAYLDGRIGKFLDERGELADAAAPAVQPAADEAEAADAAHESDEEDVGGAGRVVLRAGTSGHFEVNAYINNRSVELMADTGATYVVLTYDDARSLGLTLDLEFTGSASTANGIAKVAPVMLNSVEVGDIKIFDVQAVVAEQGALHRSLLGMSFIGRLQSFEMSGKRLVLSN